MKTVIQIILILIPILGIMFYFLLKRANRLDDKFIRLKDKYTSKEGLDLMDRISKIDKDLSNIFIGIVLLLVLLILCLYPYLFFI